jgi:hypothetical protein
VASNIGELPAGSRRILRLVLPVRSIPDREHQKAPIHGRTCQFPLRSSLIANIKKRPSMAAHVTTEKKPR